MPKHIDRFFEGAGLLIEVEKRLNEAAEACRTLGLKDTGMALSGAADDISEAREYMRQSFVHAIKNNGE